MLCIFYNFDSKISTFRLQSIGQLYLYRIFIKLMNAMNSETCHILTFTNLCFSRYRETRCPTLRYQCGVTMTASQRYPARAPSARYATSIPLTRCCTCADTCACVTSAPCSSGVARAAATVRSVGPSSGTLSAHTSREDNQPMRYGYY